jgi:hypothetical protein
MLTQQILTMSQVTDDCDTEEEKKEYEKKVERYHVKENITSNREQSGTYSDSLIFQENNKEIIIDNNDNNNNDNDDDSLKLLDNKVISKCELQGLNSIEKDIILMNENQNFNDVNLLGNELERIKRNQINNNKSFIKSFLVFILTLFICNMINEYILIKTPFILENIFEDEYEKWKIISSFIILQVFSFPLLIFCRIIKKFDIERRLLLIIYLLVLLIMSSAVVYLYLDLDHKKPLMAIILFTYLLNNCLEGVTHLLIEKIIPSFAKFCGKNMKFLFSYMLHIGKTAAGIKFFLIYFFLYKIEEKENKLEFFECIFFVVITFISFIISLICYQSLRVRAFAKLNFD